MFRINCANILTSIVAIISIFGTDPIFAADAQQSNLPNISASQPEKKNIFQQAELSEADSKQKVEELEKNAQAMKDKEQSTANKLLGAASIGATGIGGMNLMSGLAEQKSDQAAEEDMKAYLATFVCDYGQGRNIKGGEHDVSLPGGNDLFTIVNEYKALALDLQETLSSERLRKNPQRSPGQAARHRIRDNNRSSGNGPV